MFFLFVCFVFFFCFKVFRFSKVKTTTWFALFFSSKRFFIGFSLAYTPSMLKLGWMISSTQKDETQNVLTEEQTDEPWMLNHSRAPRKHGKLHETPSTTAKNMLNNHWQTNKITYFFSKNHNLLLKTTSKAFFYKPAQTYFCAS